MNAWRRLLLGALLLGLVGLGCSTKEAAEEKAKEKEKTTAHKEKIVGDWELVKSETDDPFVATDLEFTGGGFSKEEVRKIKSLTDKAFTYDIVGGGMGTWLRVGAPADKKAKGNKEKLIGKWKNKEYEPEQNVLHKDGTYEILIVDEKSGKTKQVFRYGTYVVDGQKLTMITKGDGGIKPRFGKGLGWNGGSYEIKGDKLITLGMDSKFYGMRTWLLKELTDEVLVVTDEKGKKDEYKRKATASQSKSDLLVGVWEVVKSDAGWEPGHTWEFTKDGKTIANLGGFTLGGTYKLDGDKLSYTAEGSKTEVTMTITTLTSTALATVDDNKKVNEFKKK